MGEAKLRALSDNVTAVFTMIGGLGIIGEWSGGEGAEFIQVRSPHLLQPDPQRPNNIIITKMLGGTTVLAGEHLSINMRSVLWIGSPSHGLLSAYRAARAGLVVGDKPISINQ